MRGHIRKHGKGWSIVVYLGQENNKPRYKWYSHPTRREAEARLAQLLVQVQAGGGVPPGRLRTGNFLEQWLRDCVAGVVALHTEAKHTRAVRRHITPALGAVPLIRLTPQAIQGWVSRERAGGLKPASVLAYYNVFHGALAQAVRWGLLTRNPMDLLEPPRAPRVEMRVWDEEQVRLFLAEARRSSPHATLYLTAILTGMRQGELLALREEDVDFTLGVVHVRQTLCRLGGRVMFKEPKSPAARRPVALGEAGVEAVRLLVDERRRQRTAWGKRYEDHGLVFCQPNGKPLHAHNIVRRDFHPVAKRAGLPRIRFHDLRHTHATHLLRAGVHSKVTQERLGHSTNRITMDTYSHVLPGMQAEAARLVEQRLLGHS